MKFVILAAGTGTRLGCQDTPKSLTIMDNGKSILQMQLEAIQSVASLDSIRIIVGYHKEVIETAYPKIQKVENPYYSTTNTAKSLLLGIEDLDEDVIWMNGDVVFHPSILKSVIANQQSLMVVNRGAVAEEEVKYQTDSNGRITAVSKQIKKAEGEALGINRFQAKDLPLLKAKLQACSSQDYFEKGIELCINDGVNVYAQVIDSNLCAEVDFPEDLVHANKLLRSWLEGTRDISDRRR